MCWTERRSRPAYTVCCLPPSIGWSSPVLRRTHNHPAAVACAVGVLRAAAVMTLLWHPVLACGALLIEAAVGYPSMLEAGF
jgi:hypothetical protein